MNIGVSNMIFRICSFLLLLLNIRFCCQFHNELNNVQCNVCFFFCFCSGFLLSTSTTCTIITFHRKVSFIIKWHSTGHRHAVDLVKTTLKCDSISLFIIKNVNRWMQMNKWKHYLSLFSQIIVLRISSFIYEFEMF